MKVEEIPKLDTELDGEPLSDSDYDGCFQNRILFVKKKQEASIITNNPEKSMK